MTTTTPRIYVASLADYNAGRLHGKWFDLDDFADAEELYDAVKEQVLDTSKELVAEEWAIHDYEGFGSITISEYESFDTVIELAQAIEEHGGAYAAYVDHVGAHYATVEDFEERQAGHWDSEKDFAYDYVESTGMLDNVGDSIQMYFDYDSFARDLFMGDYSSVDDPEGGIYVFRGC